MKARRYWTTVELASFRREYPTSSLAQLCARYGRTASAVKNLARKLGLRKTLDVLSLTRFKPGQRPWNAGRPYDAGGRSAQARFKPGHPGARTKPVGSERVERDGVMVKVAEPDVWKPKARAVWEANFGPVPTGKCVRLRVAGDYSPSNLFLVSRSENLRMNDMRKKPKAKRAPAWLTPLLSARASA